MENVYLISNVEEFGKLMSFCIDNDICVFRTYWNEQEKGKICYCVNFRDKRCSFGTMQFYVKQGYQIRIPIFEVDDFGKYRLGYILTKE